MVLGIMLGLIACLYGVLNTRCVQEKIKNIIISEVRQRTHTNIKIKHLYFRPLDKIYIEDITLFDTANKQILSAHKLGVTINLLQIFNKKIVVNAIYLKDFHFDLYKQSSTSPINIQFLIDAFKSPHKKSKSSLRLKINSINLNNGAFKYDRLDKKDTPNLFNISHININHINGKFTLETLGPDSMILQVKKLGLQEKKGLKIKNIRFRAIHFNQNTYIRELYLQLPQSYIHLNSIKLTKSKKPILNVEISASEINPKDFTSFNNRLYYLNQVLRIQGNISGSIENFNIQDFKLSYDNSQMIIKELNAIDIRKIKDGTAYIKGNIESINVNKNDISELTNLIDNENTRKKVNKYLQNITNINYKGQFVGYSNNIVFTGDLNSDIGNISNNFNIGFNPNKQTDFFAQGNFNINNLSLKKLLNNENFNILTSQVLFSFQKLKKNHIRGDIKIKISDFDYRKYKYHSINLNANYKNNKGYCNLDFKDPNGIVKIFINLDPFKTKEKLIRLKLKIINLAPYKLHLSNKIKDCKITANFEANIKGSTLNNSYGEAHISDLHIFAQDDSINLPKVSLSITHLANEKMLIISSNLINGKIIGNYNWSTLTQNISATLHPYLPAIINKKITKTSEISKNNNFVYDFHIGNTENINQIVDLPIKISDSLDIDGFYSKAQEKFKIHIRANNVSQPNGINIKRGTLIISNGEKKIISPDKYPKNDSIKVDLSLLLLTKKNTVNSIKLKSSIAADAINNNLAILDKTKEKFNGVFSFKTLLKRQSDGFLRAKIDILPSVLMLNKEIWNINRSSVNINSKGIFVQNVGLVCRDKSQNLNIQGKYTNNSEDKLQITLNKIDLKYIFDILNIEILKFGGQATGKLLLSKIEHKPYLNSHLYITDFSFNNTKFGDFKVASELNPKDKKVILNGIIKSYENKYTKVSGFISPVNKEISLFFDANRLNIGFISGFSKSLFNKVAGYGTGNIHLFGNFSNVTVEGKTYIQNGLIGIKLLNTDYHFTDSLYLKKDSIYFKNMRLVDNYNNEAIASGSIKHRFFHDLKYHMTLKADNFLIYNVNEKQNPVFSGKVFGSGNTKIDGNEKSVNVTVNMKTEKNTIVKMNFMNNVVNKYNFVTYTQKQDEKKNKIIKKIFRPIFNDSSMAVNMNFFIDATDNATAEIVMDPEGGDMIKGRGNGTLQLSWNSKESPRIYGTFYIDNGDYKFTFEKLMEKHFTIQRGSSVHFNGNPFDATLNVNGIYKVTANLRDLSSQLSLMAGQTNIPVNCIMNLTGELRQPQIKLDLDFPAADAEIQRELKNILNTDESINRQVAYLLILSKFYPNDNSGQASSSVSSIASATLSGQLTKIINHIDRRWQLGTNIRYSGEYEHTKDADEDIELLLSSQLLNDRLLINGNFGYRDDSNIRQKSIIGDVDFEFLLNQAGNWRIRAYNHYNEKYYYTGTTSQTQGLSIMYKKDFDKLKDLFSWRKFFNFSKYKHTGYTDKKDSVKIPNFLIFTKTNK